MRRMGLAFAVVMFAVVAVAEAGQPININALPAGARFCPAPGADNSEFMSSYFSIDAQTGQMTRHDVGSGPIGVTPEPVAEELVLFVAPPISVENVYVPPVGGPAVPPRTMATGVMPGRQQRMQPVRYSAPASPAPAYAPRQPAVPQPQYAQAQYPAQPYAQVNYPPAQTYAPQAPQVEYAQVQYLPSPQPAVAYSQYPAPAQPYVQAQYPRQQAYAQAQPYAQPQYPQSRQLQPLQQYPQTTAAAAQRGGVAAVLPSAPRGARIAR